MIRGCTDDHGHVVAGGTCRACGLPVMLSGPLPAAGECPQWCAPPFGDPSAAARCRVTGEGHQVADAQGTCTVCSVRIWIVTEPGRTWWVVDPVMAA